MSKAKNILLTIILALGVVFLFFGGTWEGVRFGLELLGGIYILQIAYSAIINKDNKHE